MVMIKSVNEINQGIIPAPQKAKPKPKKETQSKILLIDQLRLDMMAYILKTPKYHNILKHLPKSWGGSRKGGGGWSGAFLKAIEILEAMK